MTLKSQELRQKGDEPEARFPRHAHPVAARADSWNWGIFLAFSGK